MNAASKQSCRMGGLQANPAQAMGTEMFGLSKFVSHCSDKAVTSHVRALLKAGGSSRVCARAGAWVWSSRGSALSLCAAVHALASPVKVKLG